MITAYQCRAGRALANKTQADLADASSVNVRTLMDFEKGHRTPIPATLAALERGLDSFGVVLIEPDDGGGAGVRRRGSDSVVRAKA